MKCLLVVLLFLGVVSFGTTLQCYWCLAPNLENGCSRGTAVATMQCKGNATKCVAMGVTVGSTSAFERGCAYVENGFEGKECEYFKQNVDVINSCTVCDTDLCNKDPQ